MPSGAPSAPGRSCTWASACAISIAMATASAQPTRDADLDGALAHVAEAAPLDVLDDRVRLAVLVGRRLEHLRDAGVLELRLHARLVEEAREERAVVDVVAPHRLDDARPLGALDARRRGEVDVAHPAARDELEEQVATDGAGRVVLEPGVLCADLGALDAVLRLRHARTVGVWDKVAKFGRRPGTGGAGLPAESNLLLVEDEKSGPDERRRRRNDRRADWPRARRLGSGARRDPERLAVRHVDVGWRAGVSRRRALHLRVHGPARVRAVARAAPARSP